MASCRFAVRNIAVFCHEKERGRGRTVMADMEQSYGETKRSVTAGRRVRGRMLSSIQILLLPTNLCEY